MIIGLILSGVTLFLLITNQENISLKLQDFQNHISSLSPLNGKNATDEQVYKAVEEYCFYHNDCAGIRGDTGLRGQQGPIGMQGDEGDLGLRGPQGEQGPIGQTGPQGLQGEQGTPGADGRETERRCIK